MNQLTPINSFGICSVHLLDTKKKPINNAILKHIYRNDCPASKVCFKLSSVEGIAIKPDE